MWNTVVLMEEVAINDERDAFREGARREDLLFFFHCHLSFSFCVSFLLGLSSFVKEGTGAARPRAWIHKSAMAS